MTIIRHDLVSGSVYRPHLPRVGYTNLFREGVVTVSSEDAGHPKELAYNGLTHDAWRTEGGAEEWIRVQVDSQQANYMAICRHTLTGCDVTPQRSADGDAWTDLHAKYTVPDNRPIVWEWDAVAAAYWRLLIEGAAGPVDLAVINVGLRTPMQVGLKRNWAPPSLNQDVDYTNTMSEGGQILGRHVIRRGVSAQVMSDGVDYTWAREDYDSFKIAAETHPFFFWWTYQGKGEIVYGGLTERPRVVFRDNTSITAEFGMKGVG